MHDKYSYAAIGTVGTEWKWDTNKKRGTEIEKLIRIENSRRHKLKTLRKHG